MIGRSLGAAVAPTSFRLIDQAAVGQGGLSLARVLLHRTREENCDLPQLCQADDWKTLSRR